jgi:hypothetical protein
MVGVVAAQPWTFRLPVPPEGWLELALDDTAQGAPGTASADIIDRCTRDAKRRGAIVGFIQWRPDREPAPRAVLNVTAIRRQSETGSELDELETALRTPQDADLSPRTVEVVELPAGRALRVRVYAGGGRSTDAGRPASGADAVIDVVQYWLPVEGTSQVLVASSSTTEISAGNEVAALLDAMMDRLTVDVP